MRIVIIEDENDSVEDIKQHIRRFKTENNCDFVIDIFNDALAFLDAYHAGYDLVLFDIKMPMLNGMNGAKRLRKIDPYVPIVFITNMSQFAIEGYSVGAIDFILKPVAYFDFAEMIKRVMRLNSLREDTVLSVKSGGTICQILSSRIKYVSVYRKKLTFHTLEGDVDAWGSLSEIEKKLPSEQFVNSTNGLLVNLKYVAYVKGDELVIGDERLPISHLRKKEFVLKLSRYFRGGGGSDV